MTTQRLFNALLVLNLFTVVNPIAHAASSPQCTAVLLQYEANPISENSPPNSIKSNELWGHPKVVNLRKGNAGIADGIVNLVQEMNLGETQFIRLSGSDNFELSKVIVGENSFKLSEFLLKTATGLEVSFPASQVMRIQKIKDNAKIGELKVLNIEQGRAVFIETNRYRVEGEADEFQINPWHAKWQEASGVQITKDTLAEKVSLNFEIPDHQKKSPEAVIKFEETFRSRRRMMLITYHGKVSEDQTDAKGLVFNLKTSEPNVPVEIHLRGISLGTKKPFEAVAIVTPKPGQQKLKVSWGQFKFIYDTDVLEQRYNGTQKQTRHTFPIHAGDEFIPSGFPISEVGFKAIATMGQKNIRLDIINSIDRDYDLDWIANDPINFARTHVIDTMYKGREEYITDLAGKMRDPEAQKYALDVIFQGDDTINAELAPYGYKMIEIDGKLTINDFFETKIGGSRFSGKRKDAEIFVPVEQNEFAVYHGRYTHVAQLLTILYKASPQHIADTKMMFDLFSFGSDWRNLWNVLFDAPGDSGPNAPKWWAKKFKERPMQHEPASY